MRFYEKVNDLCREKGISITSLALELGFSKGTPSNWKTMSNPPRAENVKKIAEYFGVPISHFSEDTQKKDPPLPTDIISEDERRLLEKFRCLSDERKALAIQLLDPLADQK